MTLEDNIAGGQVAQKRKFSVFRFQVKKWKTGKPQKGHFAVVLPAKLAKSSPLSTRKEQVGIQLFKKKNVSLLSTFTFLVEMKLKCANLKCNKD